MKRKFFRTGMACIVGLALVATGAAVATAMADTEAEKPTAFYNFDQVVKHQFLDEATGKRVTDNSYNAGWYTNQGQPDTGENIVYGLIRRDDGQGLALQFPDASHNVPRGGILEIEEELVLDEETMELVESNRFDPRDEDFTVVAELRMDASLANHPDGMNVIQKGGFNDNQWKLQIDNGEVGCRLFDGTTTAFATATRAQIITETGVDIFDGEWHIFACKRKGDSAIITVNNQRAAIDTASAPLGDIESSEPVSIGGIARDRIDGVDYNPPAINDQFHGDMDNLRIEIG